MSQVKRNRIAEVAMLHFYFTQAVIAHGKKFDLLLGEEFMIGEDGAIQALYDYTKVVADVEQALGDVFISSQRFNYLEDLAEAFWEIYDLGDNSLDGLPDVEHFGLDAKRIIHSEFGVK